MTIKVTGCSNCPFFNNGSDFEYNSMCQHPISKKLAIEENERILGKEKSYLGYEYMILEIEELKEEVPTSIWGTYKSPITPNWCPLNKEPITIEKV